MRFWRRNADRHVATATPPALDDDPVHLLTIEAFFDGNADLGSIGCNLTRHPGLDTFVRVLTEIRDRPDVADVRLQVEHHEWQRFHDQDTDQDDWLFSDTVLVVTTAGPREVHRWAALLQPDPWQAGDDTTDPAPEDLDVPSGHRVIALWWD